MGISQAKWHKKRKSGARMIKMKTKRKFEMGRQPSMTKLGGYRVKSVRCRAGQIKKRGIKLELGNYSWGSEGIARKTRIIDVKYNASSNELVRTKTLVKGAVVDIDCTPFRQWYETHYALPLGRKRSKPSEEEQAHLDKELKGKRGALFRRRQENAKVDENLTELFDSGKLLARISSRPGQSGRADGYILEGAELDFYVKKIRAKTKKGRKL